MSPGILAAFAMPELDHLPSEPIESFDEQIKQDCRAAILWAMSTMDRVELQRLRAHVERTAGEPLATKG